MNMLCSVQAQRPVSILVDNTFDMERDGEGNTEYGTGYGSGYSSGYSGVGSGSGSGVGSGEEEEEELDACLADPLVSPSGELHDTRPLLAHVPCLLS